MFIWVPNTVTWGSFCVLNSHALFLPTGPTEHPVTNKKKKKKKKKKNQKTKKKNKKKKNNKKKKKKHTKKKKKKKKTGPNSLIDLLRTYNVLC